MSDQGPSEARSWSRRILEALIMHEIDLLSRPHVVVTEFPDELRPPTYLGPFPSANAALDAARREQDRLLEEFPELAIEVRIAPLYPEAPDPPEASEPQSPAE